ncbi:NAD-dependent epimerase/dehydratase family protein [Kozakia baliensis]|uniref:NAD-dependent epimerase/dehydratase family protein n=1 Tax=Kozakia baliensis TaxID=153496 RepID=UPI00087BABCB|nr:NAD(P)-dependent oxidoreductase [Kozakia baliensis]AOX18993.1 hypothetical protein A0U90_00250 [Kozakia baliensis]
MGFEFRLANRSKREIFEEKIENLEQTIDTDPTRPLVVVTGATGNLGRQLINSLLNANWRVRGQFRSTIPKRSNVEWVHCDFADPNLPASSLDALVQGADTVINLAAATNNVSEMNVANVTNLERLAQACVRQGVRYFGQASSMVVYGSPLTRTVDENAPLIELKHPLHKQYFAESYMREYAKSKIEGENVLAKYRSDMHIDIYRIAVATGDDFLEDSLHWGRGRRMFSLYRNSHFIAPREVARAITHLMSIPDASLKGIETYNIADSNAPTFAQFYKRSGRKDRATYSVPLRFSEGSKNRERFQPSSAYGGIPRGRP